MTFATITKGHFDWYGSSSVSKRKIFHSISLVSIKKYETRCRKGSKKINNKTYRTKINCGVYKERKKKAA